MAQNSTGQQRQLERFDLGNRRRTKEKQDEEVAETTVGPAAGVVANVDRWVPTPGQINSRTLVFYFVFIIDMM